MARVQKPAPAFETEALLPNGDFGTVKLSDYAGEERVGRRTAAQGALHGPVAVP